ncbi:hypothetical protein HID58_083237 [Brassica napus]|uniref:Uncharacterized protein n=1 Tax=Brassica napus TaxID=3708 RepID=A0ABQ7YD12_BRANA|nr:hypothetical protein HID58_083237 [Brassica napus]
MVRDTCQNQRSLSRERFCQARDFHFSSSLTTENGFNYAIVEAVGYEFKTIQLNQLVRRVLSCFDPKILCSRALDSWSEHGCRERTFKSLGEESGPVMYHTDMIQGTWEGDGTCTIRRREGRLNEKKNRTIYLDHNPAILILKFSIRTNHTNISSLLTHVLAGSHHLQSH